MKNSTFIKILILTVFFFSCKKTTTEQTLFSLSLNVPNEFYLCGEVNESEFSPPVQHYKTNIKFFGNNKFDKTFFFIYECTHILPSYDNVNDRIKELKTEYSAFPNSEIGKISDDLYSYYIIDNNTKNNTTYIEGCFFIKNIFWSFRFRNFNSIDTELNKKIIKMLKSAKLDTTKSHTVKIKNTINECSTFIKTAIGHNPNAF